MEAAINTSVTDGVNGLRQVYRQHPEMDAHQTELLRRGTTQVLTLARHILRPVADINQRAAHLNLSQLTFYLDEYSFYR